MSSILGEKIDLVRPRLIHQTKHTKAWNPKYDTSSQITISGKVALVRVKLKNGSIRSLTKGTHVDVLKAFHLDPDQVESTGWLLEDGTEIWR